MTQLPEVTRYRHEIKRRQLSVARIHALTPKMLRIVLSGEELVGFTSLGFDDHVKLLFPEGPEESKRDFTPRHYDAAAGELWIDFYLHETGPAATWASRATVGGSLTIAGPRGSSVISVQGIDTHVLVGDETALPAMGRRLEELPAGARAVLVIESDGDSAAYPLAGKATCLRVDVAKSPQGAAPGKTLIDALREVQLPKDRCFVWVATESNAARAIRRYMIEERGWDKNWIKAAGYWQRGAVGAHDVIADDVPDPK